jgi:hypothetical protein
MFVADVLYRAVLLGIAYRETVSVIVARKGRRGSRKLKM